MMQQRAPKTHKLTVELIDCSETPIVDGDGRGFTDSGEVLRKESIDYRRF
jgi:hypothetical protein